eukprot:scaffold12016_cov65-Attheya_sp.AAC.7
MGNTNNKLRSESRTCERRVMLTAECVNKHDDINDCENNDAGDAMKEDPELGRSQMSRETKQDLEVIKMHVIIENAQFHITLTVCWYDDFNDSENHDAGDATNNNAGDATNNDWLSKSPNCKRPIDLISTECTFNESNINKHDSEDVNDNYDNAGFDESTIHLGISSYDEKSHEETLSNVEEHTMIVRAMKKSKLCFIEENLASLHDDQQYNREILQILKESNLIKKSLGTGLMHSHQDLEHIFKIADITKSGQVMLSAEGTYSVDADLLSAEYRISNGNIKLRRGNRIDIIYIVNWVRAFKEKHARMPDILTEFTVQSFEEFQDRPGEDVHLVNSQMLLDHLYLHVSQKPDMETKEMFSDRSPMNNVFE